VLWLEDYLIKYKNTLVIVSHDRAFINNVITDTVYLSNRTLAYYKGNYDAFEKTREEQLKQQKKEYEANKEKREHMQAFIDKFRANAKRASLVQSRIKALARITVVEDVVEEGEWSFTFPEPGVLSASAVSCLKVMFGYSPDKILLTDVTCNVDLRSRIGIIGANGTGKSTLVKILTGELEPLGGEVKRNSQARIATFSQHHMDQLNLNLDSVENLLTLYPKTHPQLIRRHLGALGITGDLALQKVRTLSGGQKSRVAFALITWRKPHIIMMDEPTNHLDLETIDALIDALKKFAGGVVLISHDQHFLQSIGNEFWGVTGGTVKRFASFGDARNFTYSSA
jgi:ATP-binding cassette subfamily F protein 3